MKDPKFIINDIYKPISETERRKELSKSITKLIKIICEKIVNNYMPNDNNINIVTETINNKSNVKKDISKKERELIDVDRKIQDNNGYIAAAYKDKVKGLLTDGEFIDTKVALPYKLK